MTQPVLRAVGIAGGTVAAALVVATVTFVVANGWTPADAFESYALSNLVNGASLVICGTLLALARPRNALGWLLLVGGLAYLTSAAAIPASTYAAEHDWPESLARSSSVWASSAWSTSPSARLPFRPAPVPNRTLSDTTPSGSPQ